MKKGLIVLLVMVLVSSFAFAGSFVTGKFDTTFKFDMDANTAAFTNTPYSKIQLGLVADTLESAGENGVYAELAADFGLRTVYTQKVQTVDTASYNDAAVQFLFNFKYARVVGEDWTLSILKGAGSSDFAKDTVDYDVEYANSTDYYKNLELGAMDSTIGITKAPGVEFKYGNYSLAAGLDTTATGDKSTYSVAAKATDVEVAEGVKLSGGFGLDSFKTITFSAKADVASDAADVVVAGDFGVKSDKTFQSEASLSATVKAIEGVDLSVGAYWLDNAYVKDSSYNYASYYPKAVEQYYGYAKSTDGLMHKILTAQIDASVSGVGVTVKGQDVLNAQDLSGAVTYTYDAFDFEIGGGYGIKAAEYSAYLDVTYNHALFVAFAKAGYDNADGFKPTLKLTSTTLVDGAKLTVKWSGAAFSSAKIEKGALSAGCTISF